MGIFNLFFKKNTETEEKLKEKISVLESEIERKNKEISDLINEIDKINHQDAKDQKQPEIINTKQLELIEKNIKETKDENSTLRFILGQYNIKVTKERHYYKVDIYKFFSSTKFSEITEYLENNDIRYIQEISKEFLDEMPEELKNLNDAKVKLESFWAKEFIEWDIITYLNKGDKISRVYNKSRKFTNILSDQGIEFIEDMKEYNFDELLEKGFDEKKIEEFKEIRDSIYEEERVVISK